MDDLFKKLLTTAPAVPWEVVVALADSEQFARGRLYNRLTFDDLAGEPERFGALATLGPDSRISWVARHVPPGEDLEAWLGPIDYDTPTVESKLKYLAKEESGSARHVIEHLAARMNVQAAKNLRKTWETPSWVKDLAFARLAALSSQGGLGELEDHVREQLLTAGVTGVGRAELLAAEEAAIRKGGYRRKVGDILCGEICDADTSDDARTARAQELRRLVDARPESSYAVEWGLRMLRSPASGTNTETIALISHILGVPAPWGGAPSLLEWATAASSPERETHHPVIAALAAVPKPEPPGDWHTGQVLAALAAHAALNEVVADDLLAALASRFTHAVRTVALDGRPMPVDVLATLADANTFEALLGDVDRRLAAPALLAIADDELVAAVLEAGWLKPCDAALLSTTTLAALASSDAAAPLLGWVTDQLGSDPLTWRLFAELATGSDQVGALVATVRTARR